MGSVREIGASAEQLEVIGELLRDELLNLEGSSVRRLSAASPGGGSNSSSSRGPSTAHLGPLLVTLPETPGRLARMVEVVCGWLDRSRQVSGPRSVRIDCDGDALELAQAATEERNRQIDAWLLRRTPPNRATA